MKRSLVLIANAAKARICEFIMDEGSAEPQLTRQKTILNPQGRGKWARGRGEAGGAEIGPGGSRGADREGFARELSEILSANYRDTKFEALVLVASPAFLGKLRRSLSIELQRHVVHSIPKDYTAIHPEFLGHLLWSRLLPA